MMSTTSGFITGLVTAAALTFVYGDRLSASLQDAINQHPQVRALAASPLSPAAANGSQAAAAALETAVLQSRESLPEPNTESDSDKTLTHADAIAASSDEAAPAPAIDLAQRWREYAAGSDESAARGEFPYRACFQRAAASHDIPETLLLALASGESDFDHAARSGSDAIGLMQIRWPDTARHLGILREADLYDPCTNVDAGARYMVELLERYGDDYHLAIAAYNYGPGRVTAGDVPAGARWYSQYIYQHLEQVLGQPPSPTSELIPRPQTPGGSEVLMSFNRAHRARAFIDHLAGTVPQLNLQIQSERLGTHDVVLVYTDENDRRRALQSLERAGIAILLRQDTTLYL